MAQLLKPTKYCMVCMMPTVPIHSMNVKGQINVDISLHLKQNYQEPALGEFFSLRIVNLLSSPPENMLLKHRALISLKIDLIDVSGKETCYLTLTLCIPMCKHYTHC